MNKEEASEKYGKERCQDMHEFLDKLSRYYAFPYSEETLLDFLVDLESFSNEDLQEAFKRLKYRESNFLKFNDVYNVCSAIKKTRESREEWEAQKKKKVKRGIPLPENLRDRLIKKRENNE